MEPAKLGPLYGDLGALVDTLLEKDLKARPSSGTDVANALARIEVELSDTAQELPALEADTLISPRSLVEGDERTPIQPRELTPSDATGASTPRSLRSAVNPPLGLFALFCAVVAAFLVTRIDLDALRPSADAPVNKVVQDVDEDREVQEDHVEPTRPIVKPLEAKEPRERVLERRPPKKKEDTEARGVEERRQEGREDGPRRSAAGAAAGRGAP